MAQILLGVYCSSCGEVARDIERGLCDRCAMMCCVCGKTAVVSERKALRSHARYFGYIPAPVFRSFCLACFFEEYPNGNFIPWPSVCIADYNTWLRARSQKWELRAGLYFAVQLFDITEAGRHRLFMTLRDSVPDVQKAVQLAWYYLGSSRADYAHLYVEYDADLLKGTSWQHLFPPRFTLKAPQGMVRDDLEYAVEMGVYEN